MIDMKMVDIAKVVREDDMILERGNYYSILFKRIHTLFKRIHTFLKKFKTHN